MTIPPDRSDAITPEEPLVPGRPASPSPEDGFQSYMQDTSRAQKGGPAQAAGPSPAQVPQGPAMQMTGPNLDSLVAQIGTTQDSMANVQNKLNTKDLKLTRSQQHLLRNKLSDSSTYLRAVNAKLGVEVPPMPSKGSGPIERFIGYLADGQNQMEAAKQKLLEIKNNGDQLNPADFLLIQIKMNQAQQEIEYSSTLLSKVVSSLTQILNTQL